MSERALTWSYGGGTQSVAIAVLVARGRLPRPELIVMADTGHERQRTWEYTARHVQQIVKMRLIPQRPRYDHRAASSGDRDAA